MKRHYIYLVIAAAFAAVLASCAKTVSDDEKAELREFLQEWMAYTHPGVTPNSNGIYILEEKEGYGALYNDHDYAYMEVTIADLEGNISSTDNMKLSQQLGTYNETYYYGPKMYPAGDNASAGIYYTLKGMKKGGTRKVIVPFWFNTYSRYDTQEEYYKKANSTTSSVMYTITLKDFTNDEEQWEIDSLETFLAKKYNQKPDSLSYGLYYYRLAEPDDEEEFASDTTIYINYIGRLLNGQVFDTTIKDTAIVHNIYSTSKEYGPQKVAWASNAESITLGSSSVIAGFYKTLWNMHKHEKGVGYFISKLGYTSSGSGSAIPQYSPLCFEVEIVDEP